MKLNILSRCLATPLLLTSALGKPHADHHNALYRRQAVTSSTASTSPSSSASSSPATIASSSTTSSVYSSTNIPSSTASSIPSSSIAPAISSSAIPSSSLPPTASTPPFNPLSPDNIAAYIGHSPGNFNASLPALCSDPNINIVIISFIRAYNFRTSSSSGTGPLLPTFDFSPSCDSRRVRDYSAPFSCPAYAAQIAQCQSLGKKIVVSIGGSSSNTTFVSEDQAVEAATMIWDVFGEGSGAVGRRPFGGLVIDGVDVDQEGSSPTTHYDVFASTLRSLWATSPTSHPYYLSAAPLCANTTAVLPNGFYQNTHFIFARFYNARVCNVGSKGFLPSMIAWRNYIVSITPGQLYPRQYIGALSFESGNSGFVEGTAFQGYVREGANATRDRFGGVMLWDGTNGEVVGSGGLGNNRTFVGVTKEALCNGAVGRRMAGTFLGRLWGLMGRNVAGST